LAIAILRRHWVTFLTVSLAVGAFGLFLGPAIMTPAYLILQPRLGGMTLTGVEMLFAFLIDFPLAAVASTIVCSVIGARRSEEGALAGAFFFLVFALLILGCLVLAPLTPFVAWLALGDVFPGAVASARQVLGGPTLGLLLVAFVLFDLTLCTLGGIAGYSFSALSRRSPEVPDAV
jgi:hypothetical protein